MTEENTLVAEPTEVIPTDSTSFQSISPDHKRALRKAQEGLERRVAEGGDMDPWVQGRAFVYAESGEVEYFYRFEKTATFPKKDTVRCFRGGLRALDECRPLDYVCDPKYLKMKFSRG